MDVKAKPNASYGNANLFVEVVMAPTSNLATGESGNFIFSQSFFKLKFFRQIFYS